MKNLHIDEGETLLADHYGVPDSDLGILVLNPLDLHIKRRERKIEQGKVGYNLGSDASDPIREGADL